MAKQIDWSEDDVRQLIIEYKRRPILWDVSRSDSKDRAKKDKEWKDLAEMFNTTVSGTQRKIQNLRNKYNEELKKISKRKRNKRKSVAGAITVEWPHFDDLKFLDDAEEATEISNLSAASSYVTVEERESYDDEDSESMSTQDESHELPTRISPETVRSLKRRKLSESPGKKVEFVSEAHTRPSPLSKRMTYRATRPSLLAAKRLNAYRNEAESHERSFKSIFNETSPTMRDSLNEYRSKLYTNTPMEREIPIEMESSFSTHQNKFYTTVPEEREIPIDKESSISTHEPDEYEVFGTFVASEIRNLKRDANRKRLKCMIQKCILEVSEDDSKIGLSPSLYPNLSLTHTELSPLKRSSEPFKFQSDRLSRFRSTIENTM